MANAAADAADTDTTTAPFEAEDDCVVDLVVMVVIWQGFRGVFASIWRRRLGGFVARWIHSDSETLVMCAYVRFDVAKCVAMSVCVCVCKL